MCIENAKGRCKNGDRCRYAHSTDELRRAGEKETDVPANPFNTQPQTRSTVFKEDHSQFGYHNQKSDSGEQAFTAHKLRKVVHSSDYEEGVEEQPKPSTYDPAQHRYNYLNPFFFYSFNNFPVYYPIIVNQSMPFFNYVCLNNQPSDRHPDCPRSYKNSDESSQFNSKSSDEGEKTGTGGDFVSNFYKNITSPKDARLEEGQKN